MGRRQVRQAIILLQGRPSIVEMLRIAKLATLGQHSGRCARLPPNDLWAFACQPHDKTGELQSSGAPCNFMSWGASS